MEYNHLTKIFIEAGYDANNYPDYVRIGSGRYGDNALENLHGGFEYKKQYLNNLTFKTGCGLLIKGSRFTGSMSYMGIRWIPENNNPVICCPYRKDVCCLRNPILGDAHGGGLTKIFQCDCHYSDEPYTYDRSVDKIEHDESRRIRLEYEQFSDRVRGRVCHWHMMYDYWKREWRQSYDPMNCARYCMKIGGTCDLTGKMISKKKGNVFYDVKISYVRHDDTLFDGQEVIKINKGVRLFETAKSLTICDQVVKRCKDYIREKERNNRSYEIHILGWNADVLNIRAEQRESRDLMQDIQDIQDGIVVTHASDLINKAKEDKKERRKELSEQKIKKLEKKIIDVGYDNLEEYSLDKIHADKWIDPERLKELDELHKKREYEKTRNPVQMTLFDYIGGRT